MLRSVRRLCEKVVRGRLQELLSELTRAPVGANKYELGLQCQMHLFIQLYNYPALM